MPDGLAEMVGDGFKGKAATFAADALCNGGAVKQSLGNAVAWVGYKWKMGFFTPMPMSGRRWAAQPCFWLLPPNAPSRPARPMLMSDRLAYSLTL